MVGLPDGGFAATNFQTVGTERGRLQAGEITGAGVPDIHQLGNPEVSGQDLITIHIYAPPLGVLNTYKVGSPVIDLYTPDDSEA